MQQQARVTTLLSVLAATVLLLGGCALYSLKKDVTRLNAMGLIGGHVSSVGDRAAPIVVLLTSGSTNRTSRGCL